MLKFLRKYSKWMLIIFGALLMVAFTAPQVVQQFGRGFANPKVARVDGTDIRREDVLLAERQQSLLRQRLPSQVMPAIDPDSEGLHWYLLRREARDAGLIGVAGDGAMWVEDFAPQIARQQMELQLAQQIGPDLARQFAGQQWNAMNPADRQEMVDRIAGFLNTPPSNITEREYHEALSVARGVYRLTSSYFESAPLSDARARLDAAALQRSAMIEAFWIRGEDVAGIAGDPTEEQIREHYERFASTPLNGGEFGIGYTLPERLKIEYIRIDRPAIEEAITPDPLEIRKRYQAQTREREAAGQEVTPFADDRDRIEREVRREIADDVIRSAQQAFVGVMGEATRTLESEGPYKRLPEGFESSRPTFEAVAQQMVETVGLTRFPEAQDGSVSLPMPEVVRPEGWLWGSELSQLDGFGRAEISIGSARAPIAQVLFAVRELRPEMGSRLALQKGLPVTDVPATDVSGSVYFYTVLDVRDESHPDSIDEIRGQLIDDWRALQAFERMQEFAEQAAATAAERGLTAAAIELIESLGATLDAPIPQLIRVTPAAVVATGGFQPQPIAALNTEPFRDAAMEVFDSLDPLSDIEETPRGDRTIGVAIPETLSLGIGTIDSISPLTIEAYRRQADQLDMVLRLDELREALPSGNPFSLEAMRTRMNVEIIGDGDEVVGSETVEQATPAEEG
ncbi:MAG: SurA N-terminal domain-containing protein [Phycisphaerales bacterium]